MLTSSLERRMEFTESQLLSAGVITTAVDMMTEINTAQAITTLPYITGK